MRPIEFEAWNGETRYALTVGPLGQVLSSTTNEFRAKDFTPEVADLEITYRHDKEERRKREKLLATTK